MTSPISPDLRFPDLRFVPAEALVPHEQPDEHRLHSLVQRLRAQSALKNPPVVAPLDDEGGQDARYVVLDGANRATAARVAGLPHVVVQVVRYPDAAIQLSTWYHALGSFPREELERALEGIPGLARDLTRRLPALAQLARRETIACVALPGGEAISLRGNRDLAERNVLLNALVDSYRRRGRFYRVNTDSVDEVQTRHPEVTAIVVFPRFEPAEIVEFATIGSRLPGGITRHVVRWRALRLNIPLEQMADRTRSLEDKNRWLEQWLRDKLTRREVYFYEEPTVHFDE
jgi:hypothetical protein